jgi:cytochrome P450
MDPKSRYTYGQADKDHLSFGHGRQVCPGRFFAAHEIKGVMARLLMGFEFKFVEGGKRPVNMVAHELMFCDPKARLMVRRK